MAAFLTGVPAYRALRHAFPCHQVILAAPRRMAPLARLTDAVDELLPVRGLEQPIPWQGPSPDVAVNVHDRGPHGHALLHALWPSRMIAFASPGAPGEVEGPPWRDSEHEVLRWCRLLASFGIETDPRDTALRRSDIPSVAPGAVIVHPGTGAPTRQWPVERFAEVARFARAAGHQVVVTGATPEAPQATAVAGRARLERSAVLAGSLDAGELAALVADASLVISGDTGIAHLATAYGTPSVTVFGRRDPEQTGLLPRGGGQHSDARHVTVRHPWRGRVGRLGSHVPNGQPDPALLSVTVEEVCAAASALLRRAPASRQIALTGSLPAQASSLVADRRVDVPLRADDPAVPGRG